MHFVEFIAVGVRTFPQVCGHLMTCVPVTQVVSGGRQRQIRDSRRFDNGVSIVFPSPVELQRTAKAG